VARTTKQKHGGEVNTFEAGDPGGPGRPPKLLSTITAELKAKGYERATANQVADAFETLMNVPEDELRKMVNEGKSPMSLRIVGKAMLTAKGWEVLQAMLDRAHGKAKQAIDHTSDGKAIAPTSIAITREVVTRKV
jgi:hypothetical protein